MTDKPETIKSRRLIGALWYYGCHCGEPRSGQLLTGFEGIGSYPVYDVLLTGDGLIFGWWGIPDLPRGIVLTREVGRVRCGCYCQECESHKRDWGGRDQLYFDWRFAAADA